MLLVGAFTPALAACSSYIAQRPVRPGRLPFPDRLSNSNVDSKPASRMDIRRDRDASIQVTPIEEGTPPHVQPPPGNDYQFDDGRLDLHALGTACAYRPGEEVRSHALARASLGSTMAKTGASSVRKALLSLPPPAGTVQWYRFCPAPMAP